MTSATATFVGDPGTGPGEDQSAPLGRGRRGRTVTTNSSPCSMPSTLVDELTITTADRHFRPHAALRRRTRRCQEPGRCRGQAAGPAQWWRGTGGHRDHQEHPGGRWHGRRQCRRGRRAGRAARRSGGSTSPAATLAQIAADLGSDVPFALDRRHGRRHRAGESCCPRYWPEPRCTGCWRWPTTVCPRRRCSPSSTGCAPSATRRGWVRYGTSWQRWPAVMPRPSPRRSATTCRPPRSRCNRGCGARCGRGSRPARWPGSSPAPARRSRCSASTPSRPVRVAVELTGAGMCRTVRAGPCPRGARRHRPRPGGPDRRAHLMANLVNIESATVVHGMRTVLDAVSIGVQTGDRVGVLGLNGSGKTTLLKLLAGIEHPDSGRVATFRNTAVAFVPQTPEPAGRPDGAEAVLHTFGEAEHVWASDAGCGRCSPASGCPASAWTPSLRTLSGGERRRVALAAALVTDADLLAAGRAHQPPGHRGGGLAGRAPAGPAGRVGRGHPRPLVSRRDRHHHLGSRRRRGAGSRGWLLRLGFRQGRADCGWTGPPRNGGRTWRARSWPGCGGAAGPDLQAALPDRGRRGHHRRRTGAAKHRGAARFRPPSAGARSCWSWRMCGRRAVRPVHGLARGVTWRIGPGDRIGVVGVNGSGKSTLLRILVGELPLTRGRLKTGAPPCTWATCPRRWRSCPGSPR